MKPFLLLFAALVGGIALVMLIRSPMLDLTDPYFQRESFTPHAQHPQTANTDFDSQTNTGYTFTLSPASQEFGTVEEGTGLAHVITLHAPPDAPLWLGRVHSPCPCILLEETPPVVPAGSHVKIPLHVKTEGLSGDVAFPVYVQVLQPEEAILRAEVRLHVKTAVPPYRLDPAQHDFGTLHEGEARSLTLTLHRPAGTPLRLGRLHSPCPCVTVRADATRFAPDEPAQIEVDVHSLTLSGEATFPVYVSIRDPVDEILAAEVRLRVERVPAAILLEPSTLQFGMMALGGIREARLLNLTKEALQVEVLEVPAGMVVELVPVQPGGVGSGSGGASARGGRRGVNSEDMAPGSGGALTHAPDSVPSGLGRVSGEEEDAPTHAGGDAMAVETRDRTQASRADISAVVSRSNIAAGGAIHVRVRVADSLPRGAFRGVIRLATTHPLHVDVHLPVEGFVR